MKKCAQLFLVLLSLFTLHARAQDIHWSKGPYVKVHRLECIVQSYTYGIATGQVENVSKQALNHVEVTVTWPQKQTGHGGFRLKPVVLKPLPLRPGEKVSFRVEGKIPSTSQGCRATVSVR